MSTLCVQFMLLFINVAVYLYLYMILTQVLLFSLIYKRTSLT